MSSVDRLILASFLAPNMFWIYEAVATFLGRRLGIQVQICQSCFDPLEDPMVLADSLDVAFVCGLPFVRRTRIQSGQWVALAAPVMQEHRYQSCPVYYADVIVNRASSLMTFADLAGQRFCYNDLGSNSGYNLMRYRLIQAGYPQGFFGEVLRSGSHQGSLQLIADGRADCAAIDSVVLAQALRDTPALAGHLRVVESLGPYPMPPVVAAQRLGAVRLKQLRSALLSAMVDAELRVVLHQAEIQGYAAVRAADYAPLGAMHELAVRLGYETIR